MASGGLTYLGYLPPDRPLPTPGPRRAAARFPVASPGVKTSLALPNGEGEDSPSPSPRKYGRQRAPEGHQASEIAHA